MNLAERLEKLTQINKAFEKIDNEIDNIKNKISIADLNGLNLAVAQAQLEMSRILAGAKIID